MKTFKKSSWEKQIRITMQTSPKIGQNMLFVTKGTHFKHYISS